MGTPTLSSALNGFTSEFEMGSGGSHSLLPPGKLLEFAAKNNKLTFGKLINVYTIVRHKLLEHYMVKPHGQLVLVSFTHYCASTPSLSTL